MRKNGQGLGFGVQGSRTIFIDQNDVNWMKKDLSMISITKYCLTNNERVDKEVWAAGNFTPLQELP